MTRPAAKKSASTPEPTHSFETISAAQAEQMLGKNEANRSIRDRKVEQYQRDMLNGNWDLCPAPIVFDTNGRLIDGQHRLTAQVAAGVKIKWLVLRNAKPETQKVIDTGMPRNAADVLHFEGENNSTILGAVLRTVYKIKHNAMTGRRAMNISNSELLETLEQHEELRHSTSVGRDASKGMTHLSPSVLAVAHWMIWQANDEDEATAFIRRIATLSFEKDGSPVLALNRRVTELQRQQIRVKPRDYLALVIKAWNYDAKGNKVNKLALYSKTGDYVLPEVLKRDMNVFVVSSDEEQDEVEPADGGDDE